MQYSLGQHAPVGYLIAILMIRDTSVVYEYGSSDWTIVGGSILSITGELWDFVVVVVSYNASDANLAPQF